MNAALRLVSPADQNSSADQPLESGIQEILRPDADATGQHDRLMRLQDLFVENWARMAGAFAMDRTMGRVHALTYISIEPLSAVRIAERLGMPIEIVNTHLGTLLSYGLVREATTIDGHACYAAEQDGWTWFLRTLRERRKREFVPIQEAVDNACALAKEMAAMGGPQAAALRATTERIERFTKFFSELSNLLDTLVTLGAGPMIKVLRTFARLMPRSRAV